MGCCDEARRRGDTLVARSKLRCFQRRLKGHLETRMSSTTQSQMMRLMKEGQRMCSQLEVVVLAGVTPAWATRRITVYR